jgi:hypothetical protein
MIVACFILSKWDGLYSINTTPCLKRLPFTSPLFFSIHAVGKHTWIRTGRVHGSIQRLRVSDRYGRRNTIKYGDTLTGGGEGVIKSEGCISMLWRIV